MPARAPASVPCRVDEAVAVRVGGEDGEVGQREVGAGRERDRCAVVAGGGVVEGDDRLDAELRGRRRGERVGGQRQHDGVAVGDVGAGERRAVVAAGAAVAVDLAERGRGAEVVAQPVHPAGELGRGGDVVPVDVAGERVPGLLEACRARSRRTGCGWGGTTAVPGRRAGCRSRSP